MPKFKIGDRVRPAQPTYGIKLGTISGTEEGNWTVEWDDTPFMKINWDDADLVPVTIAGPVRERVVKEITSGTYGRVFCYNPVGGKGDVVAVAFVKQREEGHVDTPCFYMNATELRAAAATLLELAGALEE